MRGGDEWRLLGIPRTGEMELCGRRFFGIPRTDGMEFCEWLQCDAGCPTQDARMTAVNFVVPLRRAVPPLSASAAMRCRQPEMGKHGVGGDALPAAGTLPLRGREGHLQAVSFAMPQTLPLCVRVDAGRTLLGLRSRSAGWCELAAVPALLQSPQARVHGVLASFGGWHLLPLLWWPSWSASRSGRRCRAGQLHPQKGVSRGLVRGVSQMN